MPRYGFPVPAAESGTAALSLPMSLLLLVVGAILAAAGVGIGVVTSGVAGDQAEATTAAAAEPAGAGVKANNDGYVEALAVPSNMVGSWEGELIDSATGDDLGPMRIVIQPGQIGDEVAFTTYPGYDCDGTATLRTGGPNVRLFEKVDAAAMGETCVDAEIDLTVAPDGTLSVITCVTDRETCASGGDAQTGAFRRVG